MPRLLWILLYAVLCAAEFLISWAKEHVEERIKGKPPEHPKDDE